MKLWKRNAVVAVIVLFVCAAVYLNWSYSQEGNGVSAGTGKVLGEAALVGGSGADTDALFGNKGGASPTPSASDGTETQAPQTSSGYFASARLNRQQARDSALSLLKQAAGDEKADQASVDQANQAIQTMAANTLAEAQIENLVTAKGYGDCVAFLSDNGISVVVSASENGLTDTDTARISEIVMGETGLKASQIKIIQAS